MESWVFLLVGGLGAVGAALSLGTLAAWVRYERTGQLPTEGPASDDSDPDDGGPDGGETKDGETKDGETTGSEQRQGPPPSQASVRRQLLVRIIVGAIVATVCFVSLAQQGLLGGPVLG